VELLSEDTVAISRGQAWRPRGPRTSRSPRGNGLPSALAIDERTEFTPEAEDSLEQSEREGDSAAGFANLAFASTEPAEDFTNSGENSYRAGV